MDITIIILDIIENSIEACAKNVHVFIDVDKNKFNLLINDDGKGILDKNLSKAGLPGFSTKSNNRGYGLFQFRQYLNSHNGLIKISSSEKGTQISANWEDEISEDFKKGLAESVMVLATNMNKINFEFNFSLNKKGFKFTSEDVMQEQKEESYINSEKLISIKNMIYNNINSMEGIV